MEQTFARLVKDNTFVVIATRKGGLVKTNQTPELGKRYAAWGATLCQETLLQINEESRLIRVNTSESEITISTIPASVFVLITVKSAAIPGLAVPLVSE